MRHGETFATKRNSGYGALVFIAPILKEGIPAIEAQAAFLNDIHTDYNVCSPVRRCKQTAKIVHDITGKRFHTDRKIREYFLETFGGFKNRIELFLTELDNSGIETVLIITHGAVIAALTHILARDSFHIAEMTDYPKPGVMRVIERGQQMKEIDFNLQVRGD
jgi:broad specificity phosphatase PhoE